jgi:hypothetical protein
MKIPGRTWRNPHDFGTLLFDIEQDPKQARPLQDPQIEARMAALLREAMRANEAPEEQYQRMDLPVPD